MCCQRNICPWMVVSKTALSIVKEANAQSPLQKAHAIYNWVVDNPRTTLPRAAADAATSNPCLKVATWEVNVLT